MIAISNTENATGYRLDKYGAVITPDRYHQYSACSVCGGYIWNQELVLGMCLDCLIQLPSFWLVIAFGNTRSKYKDRAIKEAQKFGQYIYLNGHHVLRFGNLFEYFYCRNDLSVVLALVNEWASFRLFLNGKPIMYWGLLLIEQKLLYIDRSYKKIDIIEKLERHVVENDFRVSFADDESFDIYDEGLLARLFES
ncbi:MAG: hypothetical protein LBS21_06785 [Clostridiales bacterium]|nr:hypothetical protein [Clostridiales bacterium]